MDIQRSESTESSQSTDSSGRKRSNPDFTFHNILGEGSYSTVIMAKEIETGKLLAVKMLDKNHIIRQKKTKYVNLEKQVLLMLDHPFVVKLYHTYQDKAHLYFVLEYAPNGDMLDFIIKKKRFDLDCTRFYTAQILVALDYIHSKGVIHRDLKPENILLNQKFHILITDFGTAKILKEPIEQERASFVGTAEYCPPELLDRNASSKASDVWAFGCIFYQLLVGQTPFRGSNEYQTFQKILNLKFVIPEVICPDAAHLISSILVLEPTKRPELGLIKSAKFFAEFDFDELDKRDAPFCVELEPIDLHVPDLPSKFDQMTFSDEDELETPMPLSPGNSTWLPSEDV